MNNDTLVTKNQVSKPFEDVLIILVSGDIIFTDLKVHEWKDM